MDFHDWLEYGIANAYVTRSFCETHDGMPMTEQEISDWENGDDPCHHAVRLIYNVPELKELARKN